MTETSTTLGRDDILARYRALRRRSQEIDKAVEKHISRTGVFAAARAFGVLRRDTFFIDSVDEWSLVADYAVHARRNGNVRALDRYRRAVHASYGHCDPVLDAMCASRFAVLAASRRHEVCGWVVEDLLRQSELWLVDEALENALEPHVSFATWICRPDEFWISVGTLVPIDHPILVDAASRMNFLTTKGELADHPGLVREIYRSAIGLGALERRTRADNSACVMPTHGVADVDAVQHRT
jgi:hypothetical protein